MFDMITLQEFMDLADKTCPNGSYPIKLSDNESDILEMYCKQIKIWHGTDGIDEEGYETWTFKTEDLYTLIIFLAEEALYKEGGIKNNFAFALLEQILADGRCSLGSAMKRIHYSRKEVGWISQFNNDPDGLMSETEAPPELEGFVEKILEVIDLHIPWLFRRDFIFKTYSKEECDEFSKKLDIEINQDSDLIYVAKKLGGLL